VRVEPARLEVTSSSMGAERAMAHGDD